MNTFNFFSHLQFFSKQRIYQIVGTVCVMGFLALTSCNDDKPKQVSSEEAKTIQDNQTKQSATTATVERTNPMGKYEKENSQEQVAFNVDADKVGAFINDTKNGISFAPPRNFVPVQYLSLPTKSLATKFTMYSSPKLTITPLHTFRDRTTLVISKIDFSKSNLSYKQFLTEYESLIRANFAGASVTPTFFMKGNIRMTQYFIQEADNGLFRIVFAGLEPKTAFQFDFTINRITASDDMQAIEPAIGTIALVNKQ